MAQVVDSSVTFKFTIDEAVFFGRLLGNLSEQQVESIGLDPAMHRHLFAFFKDAGFNREVSA